MSDNDPDEKQDKKREIKTKNSISIEIQESKQITNSNNNPDTLQKVEEKINPKTVLNAILLIGSITIGIGFVFEAYDKLLGILVAGVGLIIVIINPLLNKYVKTSEEGANVPKKSSKSEIKQFEDYSLSEIYMKFLGCIIILVGLVIVISLAYLISINSGPYIGLGIVGIGSFLVVLLGAFLLSDKWNLQDGEFRKALTISIISVYMYSMAFSDKIFPANATYQINATLPEVTNSNTLIENVSTNITNGTIYANVTHSNIAGPVFDNLWIIVVLVLTFYFTTKIIEKGGGD